MYKRFWNDLFCSYFSVSQRRLAFEQGCVDFWDPWYVCWPICRLTCAICHAQFKTVLCVKTEKMRAEGGCAGDGEMKSVIILLLPWGLLQPCRPPIGPLAHAWAESQGLLIGPCDNTTTEQRNGGEKGACGCLCYGIAAFPNAYFHTPPPPFPK